MRTIHVLFFCICLSVSGKMFSQTEHIKAKSFVQSKSVSLRWIPTNQQTFATALKYGYKIERSTVVDSTALYAASLVFNELISQPIKPLASTDSTWKVLMRKNKATGMVYNSLYTSPKNTNQSIVDKKKADEINFGLFLLTCDLHVELAKSSGLFFRDTTIDNNKKYIYRISMFNPPTSVKNPFLLFFVDASKVDTLPIVNDLKANFKGKQIELIWNAEIHKSHFASYIIERSEDSLSFVQINDEPFVQLQSQYEKEKVYATYMDTFPDNIKHYYFRIKGVNHFGIVSYGSNVVKGKGKKLLEANPMMDTVYAINNTYAFVKWNMPDGFDVSELKGFNILRSESDAGKYRILNKKIISASQKYFVDSVPLFSGYYKVEAINSDDDTGRSFSWLLQLSDNEAPIAPLGLNGKIDSTGIVTLMWNKNNETDLKGYRVFKCNSLKEEFVEVTKIILTDTLFKDSVHINTLTKNVFYSITAVDKFYNNSDYSMPLKLKRPDIIPPVPPVINKYTANDTSVYLQWINSSSDDVLKCVLTRRSFDSNKIDTLISILVIDTISFYNDKSVLYGKTYSYTLTVVDESGNQSYDTTYPVVFEPAVRPAIADVQSKVNYDKRVIELSWTYPYNDLYSYTIYKAKKGEELRLLKTIKPEGGKQFIDADVKANTTYVYQIKALFNNGSQSRHSKVIEVVY